MNGLLSYISLALVVSLLMLIAYGTTLLGFVSVVKEIFFQKKGVGCRTSI